MAVELGGAGEELVGGGSGPGGFVVGAVVHSDTHEFTSTSSGHGSPPSCCSCVMVRVPDINEQTLLKAVAPYAVFGWRSCTRSIQTT